jgi:hypothetical protein
MALQARFVKNFTSSENRERNSRGLSSLKAGHFWIFPA